MSAPLDQQVALVTGASRGIGRAVACALARAGAYVVVNFVRDTAAAEETVRLVQSAGGRAECAQFDVADSEAVHTNVAGLVRRLGRCDILVNNAGITADALVLRTKEADWDRVMAVNLRGTFSCTKAVARTMVRARYGRIVNITSVVGEMGNIGQAAYAASKAGIIGFTKSVARELASRNITANAVAPGFIVTDMVAGLPEATRSGYQMLVPLGRLGTAEEVAEAVTFLARPESSYITGQVLGVNGGLYT